MTEADEDMGNKGYYVMRGPDGAQAELIFTRIGDSRIKSLENTTMTAVF